MPYTYAIEDRVVHVSWHGVISKEDLQSIGRDMPRIGLELGFAPNVLHTYDGVTGYSFQPIAVYMYSLMQKRAKIPTPVRAAVVAITPEAKALAKVFKTLNRTENLKIEVFESEADGRRWLSEK